MHLFNERRKVDCKQSLFSQSSLSSVGLERAKWPRLLVFLLSLASLDFLARVTILRDCSQSRRKAASDENEQAKA